MAKSVVILLELPSEFSADPLTEAVRQGTREMLRVAVEVRGID